MYEKSILSLQINTFNLHIMVFMKLLHLGMGNVLRNNVNLNGTDKTSSSGVSLRQSTWYVLIKYQYICLYALL